MSPPLQNSAKAAELKGACFAFATGGSAVLPSVADTWLAAVHTHTEFRDVFARLRDEICAELPKKYEMPADAVEYVRRVRTGA